MGALLIIAGAVYFAVLFMVVIPLCFGVIVNTWREAMHREEDQL